MKPYLSKAGRPAPLAALLGSAWAAFLLPPQLLAWDGPRAPAWTRALSDAPPYDLLRAAGAAVGIRRDYTLFGILVAPAFVLVGVALLRAAPAGRLARAVAWLTLLGAPLIVASYGGHALGEPWDALWGTEALLLLAIGLCATAAGVRALARRRAPVWWSVLLASTLPVLVASTVLTGYFPHGTLVGYGIQVAVLAAGAPRPSTAAPVPAGGPGEPQARRPGEPHARRPGEPQGVGPT